ncbi:MAG: SxtJ family membrane protein [Bdellovibrionota bacterium]
MAAHESLVQTHDIKTSTDRSFGLVFAAVFALVGVWPLFAGRSMREWAFIVAGAFFVVALTRPVLLRQLNKLWTRFGFLLQKITNPIVMGVLFYVLVTPVALVLRVLGKDPLKRSFDKQAKSYWVKHQTLGTPKQTMRNQF